MDNNKTLANKPEGSNENSGLPTAPEISPEMGLLDLLGGFVEELRLAGIPVSLTENLDAISALSHIQLIDREVFKSTLSATLVKNHSHQRTFDTAFEVYFSLRGKTWLITEEATASPDVLAPPDVIAENISNQLLEAIALGDENRIAELARMAVQNFANMTPGRPVGGTYYLYRTLRAIDMDALLEALMEDARQSAPEAFTDLEERLVRDDFEIRLEHLRQTIESEIRRRLVADRGSQAVAKTVRQTLPEDIEFMHASRQELDALKKAIVPLARKLAARLSKKRRHGQRGPLDFRNTIRHSLSYGGVPIDPKYKYPKPYKPEIVVLADVSGSVSAFARFTLHLVYALASYFTKIRTFVFIDGIDEVTSYFEQVDDIGEAIHRINTEADVIWVDGHSDYGHAFEVFWEKYKKSITPKTTLLILGDARNNYHASSSWIIKEAKKTARKIFWLNPEPKAYWDTGDSILGDYATYVDDVYEVRNLRQLTKFVERL